MRRRSAGAVPSATGIFPNNWHSIFISNQIRNRSSIPHTTLKAERGQPVTARRFLEGE